MNRLVLILLGLFATGLAHAQVVPAPTGTAAMVCANNTVVPTPTDGKFFYVQCDASGKLITSGSGSGGTPGGTSGQVQYNNSGTFGGFTVNGDGTLNTGTGALVVTKTNGASFGPYSTATQGQLPGTTTNDDAATGNIGEYPNSSVAATNVSLTTATAVNSGATITLTAGDWDVYGQALFAPASTTSITQWYVSLSTVSGTLGSVTTSNIVNTPSVVPGSTTQTLPVGPIRVKVANGNTQQLWLVIRSNFTVSTQTGGGSIFARRAR